MGYFNPNNPYDRPYSPFTYPGIPQPQSMTVNNGSPVSVVKVHGREGALAFSLPPNSSAILLDDGDKPIIWFKQTDGAGYPTVTGYSFAPLQEDHIPQQTAEYDTLSKEVASINKRLQWIEKELGVNGESNSGSNVQPAKQAV